MISTLKHWKTDVPAGLIVFLVAIPLCLGIALASGAPALSGIISGIVGGLIVTLFSNSSLGVSGPAAGLVAIVQPAIEQLGFQNFLLAVALGGVIQFLLGLLRAGAIGYYFPTAVIKGMLVAIGLLIVLKQIPHALGWDKDYEGDLSFWQPDGANTFTEIARAINEVTPSALIISIVCLAILILWETKFLKQFSFTKIIQGPLVAVVAGILLNLAFIPFDTLKLEKDHLVSLPDTIEFTYPHFKPSAITSTKVSLGHGSSTHDEDDQSKSENGQEGDPSEEKQLPTGVDSEAVPATEDPTENDEDSVAGEVSAAAGKPDVSAFSAGFLIFFTGLTMAVVASIESLLCAEATDKLDPQRRQTDLNQELKAQGIGNFVSGLIGGLPVTQVIVRSSTNIQSGAQSRLAAFVHGVFLVGCVLAIPGILNKIPLASLAAILFIVGWKLAHPSKFKAMFALGWTQFLPFIITIAAILYTDLLIGIGIGLVASLFFILRRSYFKSFWISSSEENGRKTYRMVLAERVFFINKARIGETLKDIEPGSKLIIDASNTVHVDQDVVDVFDDFDTHAEYANIEVERLESLAEGKDEEPARVRGMATDKN